MRTIVLQFFSLPVISFFFSVFLGSLAVYQEGNWIRIRSFLFIRNCCVIAAQSKKKKKKKKKCD